MPKHKPKPRPKPKPKRAAPEKSGAVSYEGIAILGSHPATVELAPFDKPWKIYACSPHNYEHRDLPRIDEWFEIHLPAKHETRAYRYQEFLKTLPLVWMRDKVAMPNYPGARLYPEEELKAIFGPFTFTSTIAFMLAKAIVECEEKKIPRIGMWGIMQAGKSEYAYQRPGIQNLIWEADKRGIKVIAPDVSQLFEPMPEGF